MRQIINIMRLKYEAKLSNEMYAEMAVPIVERWILACLRHPSFFCLPELHQAIAKLLPDLNDQERLALLVDREVLCALSAPASAV